MFERGKDGKRLKRKAEEGTEQGGGDWVKLFFDRRYYHYIEYPEYQAGNSEKRREPRFGFSVRACAVGGLLPADRL